MCHSNKHPNTLKDCLSILSIGIVTNMERNIEELKAMVFGFGCVFQCPVWKSLFRVSKCGRERYLKWKFVCCFENCWKNDRIHIMGI